MEGIEDVLTNLAILGSSISDFYKNCLLSYLYEKIQKKLETTHEAVTQK